MPLQSDNFLQIDNSIILPTDNFLQIDYFMILQIDNFMILQIDKKAIFYKFLQSDNFWTKKKQYNTDFWGTWISFIIL